MKYLSLFTLIIYMGMTPGLLSDHYRIYPEGVKKHNSQEIVWLAKNIYFEARNQPLVGQIAVGQVVMNRYRSLSFPNSIYEVITQDKQFSWYSDKRSNNPKNITAFAKCYILAKEIYEGKYPDLINKSVFYHTVKVDPVSLRSHKVEVIISNHVFKSNKIILALK